MNKGIALLGSIGLGAGLMYLFDPNSGRRRRAILSDKVTRLAHDAGDALSVAARDLNNRAHGIAARASTILTDQQADDVVMCERVRAKMGRYVSHPHAIRVTCENGQVTLGGPILVSEVDRLLAATLKVPGVKDVVNWLEVHETPGNIPSLQGGKPRTGQAPEFFQTRWSPAARLVAGTVGSSLAAYSALKPGPLPKALGVAGLGILVRSVKGGAADKDGIGPAQSAE